MGLARDTQRVGWKRPDSHPGQGASADTPRPHTGRRRWTQWGAPCGDGHGRETAVRLAGNGIERAFEGVEEAGLGVTVDVAIRTLESGHCASHRLGERLQNPSRPRRGPCFREMSLAGGRAGGRQRVEAGRQAFPGSRLQRGWGCRQGRGPAGSEGASVTVVDLLSPPCTAAAGRRRRVIQTWS